MIEWDALVTLVQRMTQTVLVVVLMVLKMVDVVAGVIQALLLLVEMTVLLLNVLKHYLMGR